MAFNYDVAQVYNFFYILGVADVLGSIACFFFELLYLCSINIP